MPHHANADQAWQHNKLVPRINKVDTRSPRTRTMASFVRGKQAGIQNDLSASIRPELFTPDDQARYGINSQIRYSQSLVGICPSLVVPSCRVIASTG